jgi:hydrogenase maturation protein HypF
MAETVRLQRRRLEIRGQVQGVGFRPYVYRLAHEFGLGGCVLNDNNGAVIEIEGRSAVLDAFERELHRRLPPLARIAEVRRTELPVLGEASFCIRDSQAQPSRRPEVTPDAATCADCLRELFDSKDRRYRYPFINCTNCGPRYSIIKSVPYDRPATTMSVFVMCPACQSEYDDPADRRFHAQPNACPACGPRLRLCRAERLASGQTDAGRHAVALPGDPLRQAARLLAEGGVVAVKGIGGYHLACRADCEATVRRLRQRKLRDGKPLALMVPSLEVARQIAVLTDADEQVLTSPAAPIVLAPKRCGHGIAPGVAPDSAYFGIMLPYAPVHHLLFAEGLGPLVMTSANLHGQPLTFRDEDALRELHAVADAFLMHDREIYRPIDDSVVFTFRGQTVPVRRARGYAPRPLRLALIGEGEPLAAVRNRRLLAVGGELKSTVCLLTGGEAIVSEHLGDLSNAAAYRHFVEAIARLEDLYGFVPELIAHDLHPQYLSTQYAARRGVATLAVQHHHAHVASVMAEHGEPGPVVGLACDGTGYGTDGATWGCEVLYCERGAFRRLGHLEYFPLLGADAAAIDTWRPAAALLRQTFGTDWIEHMPDSTVAPAELARLERMAAGGVNAPPSSSLGRLFDAVSYLLGLCSKNRHEAEAAMTLEAAASEGAVEPYPYEIIEQGELLVLSVRPMIRSLCKDRRAGVSVGLIASRFHETIAALLAEAAGRAARVVGVSKVALSGGCFANRRLLTRVVELLEAQGMTTLWHRQVPSGDGGLSLGQAYVAAWQLACASAPDAAKPGRGV